MVDDLAGLTNQADAPAEIPPAQSDGQASSGTDVEERIKGLQRLIAEREQRLAERDQRLAAIEQQLEEQRLASLPEDERETFRQRKAAEELNKLRLENELLRLRQDTPPDVFEAYTTLLSGKNAAEQIAFLAKKLTPASPQVTPPVVNKNNPQRTPPKGVILSDGSVMDEAMADRILGAFNRVPSGR